MAYDKFVPVDSVTYQFPDNIRAVFADNLESTSTTEGTALTGALTTTEIPSFSGGAAAGTIMMYAGQTAPAGWLLCEGQTGLSATTYADLYAAIGISYGGTLNVNFNLPDMRGRLPVGRNSANTGFAASLNNKGGAETHTLTSAQIPAHGHFVTSTATGSNHRHWVSATDRDDGNGSYSNTNVQLHGFPSDAGTYSSDDRQKGTGRYTAYTGSDHTHNYSTTGGSYNNEAHSNLQPYIVVNYIIKT